VHSWKWVAGSGEPSYINDEVEESDVAGPKRGLWRGPVASVVSSGPSGDGYKEEERPRRLSLNQCCYFLLHW
jgi:hypothetical protein